MFLVTLTTSLNFAFCTTLIVMQIYLINFKRHKSLICYQNNSFISLIKVMSSLTI